MIYHTTFRNYAEFNKKPWQTHKNMVSKLANLYNFWGWATRIVTCR